MEGEGGYDCQPVEDPPDDLVCPICLQLTKEPHLISCCGRKLCYTCVSRIQLARQPCPCCREERFQIMRDKGVERQVLSVKVYCKYKDKGCTWTGELRDHERHVESCQKPCSELITAKNSIIEQQAQKLRKLEERNKEISDRVIDLQKEIEIMQQKHTNRIDEKDREIERQAQHIRSMLKLKDSKSEQETVLKRTIEALKIENEELKRQLREKQALDPLQDVVSDLKKSIDGLKIENENLRHELQERPHPPPPPHHPFHHGPPRHRPPHHGPRWHPGHGPCHPHGRPRPPPF